MQFDLIANLDRGQYLPILELGIDHVVMQAFQRGVTLSVVNGDDVGKN